MGDCGGKKNKKIPVLDREKEFRNGKIKLGQRGSKSRQEHGSHSGKESLDPAFRHNKGVGGTSHLQGSSPALTPQATVASCLSPPLT